MTDVPIPSYRVRPAETGPNWRLITIGGGLAATVAVAAALVWGISGGAGPRHAPLIEADPRPIKVRPDDPGGLRVPNQDELIFERNRGSTAMPGAMLAPEPEAPRIDALRAQMAPPPVEFAPPRAAAPPPAAAPAAGPQPAAQQPAPAPAAARPAPADATAPATRPEPAPGGTIRVQLGALTSEADARGEWDRLARRHADLLGAFRPQVVRFDRDGQATLFRLRTGGFADAASARAFCDQVRERNVPCIVVR